MSYYNQKKYLNTTSTTSCYSNMNFYGANGRFRPIVPPVPVTVNPEIFHYVKPHQNTNNKIQNKISKNNNCSPYTTFNNFCQ